MPVSDRIRLDSVSAMAFNICVTLESSVAIEHKHSAFDETSCGV